MLKKRASRPPGLVVVPARSPADSSSPVDADEPQVRDLRRLHEFTSRMAATRDVEAMFRDVLQSALAVNGARQGIVFTPHPDRDGLRATITDGVAPELLPHVGFLPRGSGASGVAFAEQRRVVVADTESDLHFEPHRALARAAGFRAVHSTPLITRDGRLVAVLTIYFPAPHLVSEREMRLIDLYARQAADLIEGAQLRERLERELAQREATALQEADETLRARERQMQLICDAVPALISFIDGERRYRFCNRAYEQWFGISPAKIIGRPLQEVLGDAAWARLQPLIDLAFAGQTVDLEIDVPYRHGGIRWVHLVYTPHRDEHDRIAGVISIVSDITSARRLDSDRRRLAAIVESAQDSILSKDLTGKITSWNAASERLYGFTAEEIVGENVMRLYPAERIAEEAQILAQIARGEEVAKFETVRMRKDGSLIDVLLAVAPIKDESGAVVGASTTAQDISDRKKATEALKAANAMAQQRMAALEVLNETGAVLAADHEASRIVQTVTHASRELACAAWSVLFLNVENAPGNACPLPAVSGIPREALTSFPARKVFEEVLQRGNPVRTADIPMGEGEFVARSCLGVPVRSRSGRVLGALFLGHPEPHFFTPEAMTVIAALAAQAAVAIDNANLYAAFQRELAAMNRLHALNTKLVGAAGLDNVLEHLLGATLALMDTPRGMVHLHDPSSGTLRVVAHRGVSDAFVAHFNHHPLATWQKYLGADARSIFENVDEHALFEPHRGMLRAEGIRAVQTTPLLGREGHVLGLLSTHYCEPHHSDARDLKLLDLFAAHAAGFIERARSQQLVQAREQQLLLVTDHAPIYLAQCDAQYRFKFVNRTMAERYKLSREEILGRTVPEITGEAAFLVFKHHMDDALAGKRVEFEEEIPYTTLGRRWVHVLYEPERDATGAVIGFVAVVVDITSRKQAESELERARDEAVAASRAKDDFLAALSHELRTPLSPVLLLASDATNNPALPSELRASFEMIRSNISLEARLIDDLLDLTRITRGKMSLEKQHIDVHDVLREGIAGVQADAGQKRQRLNLALVAQRSNVQGDPVRLQQVFWNILKNAVKFTPEEGEISVRTGVKKNDGVFFAEVTDSGIGMTPREISRAFDAFAQGDHASPSGPHRFGGLGLGLAISQKLIEMHEGRIVASSEGRNRGSTFTIELPLATMTSHPSDHLREFSQSPFPAQASAEDSARIRLLLVEDHPATRVTLEKLLTRRNYDVITAASATEARAIASSTSFDLVVSDVGLPDGDGYQLMTELRAENPALTGIALSGYGMEDDLRRSQAAGFSAHLVKPVSMGALERAISSLIRK